MSEAPICISSSLQAAKYIEDLLTELQKVDAVISAMEEKIAKLESRNAVLEDVLQKMYDDEEASPDSA